MTGPLLGLDDLLGLTGLGDADDQGAGQIELAAIVRRHARCRQGGGPSGVHLEKVATVDGGVVR